MESVPVLTRACNDVCRPPSVLALVSGVVNTRERKFDIYFFFVPVGLIRVMCMYCRHKLKRTVKL